MPSLHVDYKHSRIKQYHKEGRACAPKPRSTTPATSIGRTGCAICPPFGSRLQGQSTSSRRPTPQPRPDPRCPSVHRPDRADPHPTPAPASPGCCFGAPHAHALLQALLIHRLLPHGFTNRELRTLVAPLLGTPPEDIAAGKMTYDLRRLRAHGLITRVPVPAATRSPTPGSHRRCCSPTPTTIYCAPDWPRSPTPTRPPHPGYAPPTAPTRPPSTNSPTTPTSPHDTSQQATP